MYSIVDKESGEVIRSGSDTLRKKIDIDNGYIMFFHNGLEIFTDLWKTDQKIYYELCFEYGYCDSFSITATFKQKLCTDIEVGTSSLTKAISRLVESGLLLRLEKRGEYRINILYSYMGNLKDREKYLIRNRLI